MRLSRIFFAGLMTVCLCGPLAAQVGPEGVVLRAGDLLRIRVWPDSMLGGEYPVQETGEVSLPVLGSIVVAGRPIGELRRELTTGYLDAMREPVVSITPVFRVSVTGAVQRAGVYWIDPTQNLFDVIAEAGGFSDNAKESDVRLVRGNEVVKINADQILQSGEGALALQPQSGDHIVVPRKSRLNFSTLLTLAQTIAIVVSIITR